MIKSRCGLFLNEVRFDTGKVVFSLPKNWEVEMQII